MKRLSLLFIFVLAAVPVFAQDGLSAMETRVWVRFISVEAIMLVIAAHAIFINLKQKQFRTDYTVDEFRKNRTDAALGALTQSEIDALNSSLDSIDGIWGEIVDSKGDTVTYPHKNSTLKQSVAIIAQTTAANPANKGIVDKINSYNEVLNHALSRQFTGSKALIAIAVIIGLFMGLGTGIYAATVATITTVVAYIFASRTPNFMLIEQISKSGSKPTTLIKRLLVTIVTGVSAAKATNGNGRGADDNHTWYSIVLIVVLTLVLAFLLPVITLVNYLRNYLIHK